MKVFKNGNGLVVALPSNICRELEIGRGDHLAISVGSDDTIFVKKITELQKSIIKPKIIKIT